MANFKTVNKVIKAAFPALSIEVVRSEDSDYVYFDGADGFDKVATLWVHPVCTSTDSLIEMACQEIRDIYP